MSITYREATIDDISVIMEIRFAVKENVLSNPNAVTPAMCVDYLDKLGHGWVAERDQQVVGFSYAASADNSIWALFVLPQLEGHGIGKNLLKLAADWLFQRGADQIKLGTQPDTRADRFYGLQGWTRGEMKNDIEVIYTMNRSLV
ncbi:GNAT family N-acetyltransferase [Undibacterium sp. Jales W-56]|uniref:GNAT family N-acetyltransferase n=1 Tax=Undibacterium sp. Jales W-56 TaxID=2897325 RepID=UPI0021D051D5|nr:GNAT family N-acetyltransferase [Undibacterium sp. Jales W-56]MCU6435704.1 GNAT family N-acetyltransferase [Undibacterium sp. Jales W-56]